jgi:hypothetical protein
MLDKTLQAGSSHRSVGSGWTPASLLVQVFSAPVAIIADVLSFLGSAFFLGRIRPTEPRADEGGGSIMAGARFIARSGIVRGSLIAVGTVNFFNLMFNALYLAMSC